MRWLTAVLTWLSADPAVVDACAARSAAAVECAYASMAREEKRQDAKPQGGKVCPTGNCPSPQRK